MIAASIGAIVAVVVGIFPWMNIILRFIFMNIAAAVVMLIIAFGRMKVADLMKQLIALYLITYALGGLMNSIYYHTSFRLQVIRLGNLSLFSNISWKYIITITLLMIPAVMLFKWVYQNYQSSIREVYELEMFLDSNSLSTRGLMDTGNCLYDPIFKKPVIIVEYSLIEELLTPQFRYEYERMKSGLMGEKLDIEEWSNDGTHHYNFRIIPYQSIGKPQGLMLGMILDKVLIHSDKEVLCSEKVIAAVCDNHLSIKNEYHVILHKGLLQY